jgi:hypothetical protein
VQFQATDVDTTNPLPCSFFTSSFCVSMTGSRSKKNRAETSALPTLAQVESEQFNNKRCKFCEASVFCSKTCLPSSCAMLLFCRRSSKIIKSFHSCSEVFWIIARSRVGVAKKQEQGESTWRKHLGNACM